MSIPPKSIYTYTTMHPNPHSTFEGPSYITSSNPRPRNPENFEAASGFTALQTLNPKTLNPKP